MKNRPWRSSSSRTILSTWSSPSTTRAGTSWPTTSKWRATAPKANGLEVPRKLRADARTASIPVVMMTSSREERDIFESCPLGVASCIVKPDDFEQFSQAIRQLGLSWLVVNQPPPG